eukprot:COSAG06_NODE_4764_length_3973_cov_2.013677_6_plen_77_part_00
MSAGAGGPSNKSHEDARSLADARRTKLNLRVLAVAAENESAINRRECSSYVASAFLFLAPTCTRPCPATLLTASSE